MLGIAVHCLVCEQGGEPILVVPELEVGEVLLFLKYLFSPNIARFCSTEDLPILAKV